VNCRSFAHDLEKLRTLLSTNLNGGRLTMRVGIADEQYRLDTTTKLYGRTQVERSLRSFLSKASRGHSSFVTVEGQSGSGKTVVISRTLLPLIAAQNGLWVSVKAQIHAQHTFSTVTEMINGFLRPLLLTPHLDAVACKAMVAEALGDGPMLIMAAEVDPDLRAPFGFPQPLTGDDAEPNSLRRMACQAAVIRLIQRVARELKPVVIFIDDCQWLPETDVSFLTSLVEGLQYAPLPLTIVCAYRPKDANDEAQRTFHESPLLLLADEHLKLGPLSDEVSFDMIADALGPPREAREELSEGRRLHTIAVQTFLRQSSILVPMFIRQMLVIMRDRGILTFDWSAEAWTFDPVQATLVGDEWKSSDSAQFLRGGVLDQLPQAVKDLLVAASTLSGAGPFSADVLAVVLDRPAPELLPLMSFLVQRQILSVEYTVEHGSNASTISLFNASSILHTFSHDQWIEASYALCPVNERAELYHLQAVRLGSQATRSDVLVSMSLVRAHELGKTAFSIRHDMLITMQGTLSHRMNSYATFRC
jgi:predicted ATPase